MTSPSSLDVSQNHLLYGDCTKMLQLVGDETVDLVYLDPPFNSQQNYNMLFGSETGEDTAQIRAFDDTWYWRDTDHGEILHRLLMRGGAIGNMAEAMHLILGRCGMLAYLLYMTERLIALHRVMKPTASPYLHCDPTASHYLKIVLDAVFGASMFRNEIVWKRSTSHNDAKRMGKTHDIIFFFARSHKPFWNKVYQEYEGRYLASHYQKIDESGRRFEDDNLTAFGLSGGGYLYDWKGVKKLWRCPEKTMRKHEKRGRIYYTRNGTPRLKRFLDEMPGVPLQDVWNDIPPINSQSAERLGYPTQKPVALLKRIIQASCPEGGLVLDPFCGCGTAIDAAQALGRRWIGMDISCLAVNVMQERMMNIHGPAALADVNITGIPTSPEAARMLFSKNPFEFERWAVGLVRGKPNDRQTGDGGSDGELVFPSRKRGRTQRGVISVKGGARITPSMVRDLNGAVSQFNAQIGLLILMAPPTDGMKAEADKGGVWRDEFTSRTFPRIQIITIDELLAGTHPDMPSPLSPYVRAHYSHEHQHELL